MTTPKRPRSWEAHTGDAKRLRLVWNQVCFNQVNFHQNFHFGPTVIQQGKQLYTRAEVEALLERQRQKHLAETQAKLQDLFDQFRTFLAEHVSKQFRDSECSYIS